MSEGKSDDYSFEKESQNRPSQPLLGCSIGNPLPAPAALDVANTAATRRQTSLRLLINVPTSLFRSGASTFTRENVSRWLSILLHWLQEFDLSPKRLAIGGQLQEGICRRGEILEDTG